MEELKKAQVLYAMKYHQLHGQLPTKLPATVEECAKNVTGPSEQSTPPISNPILVRPSLRAACKRGRIVADTLRREQGTTEVVEPVDFVWDSDSDADTPDLQTDSESESDSDCAIGNRGIPPPEPSTNGSHFKVKISGVHHAGKVTVTFLSDGSQVDVLPEQVPKAVRTLDPAVLRDVMCAKNCRCSRQCFSQTSLQTVKLARMDLLNNSTDERTAQSTWQNSYAARTRTLSVPRCNSSTRW